MTESIFNDRARQWDTPGRIKLAASVAAAVRISINLTPDMTLMDFGAGTGLLSLELMKDVKKVIALDNASEMLQVLGEKRLDDSNVSIIDGDYRSGILEGLEYHVAVSSMALHHVEDYAGLIEKLASRLLPGGILGIADLEKEDGNFHSDNTGVHHFGFSREELEAVYKSAGLVDISFVHAAAIPREQADGSIKPYNVFLATGRKKP